MPAISARSPRPQHRRREVPIRVQRPAQQLGEPLDISGLRDHAVADVAFGHEAHFVGSSFGLKLTMVCSKPLGSSPEKIHEGYPNRDIALSQPTKTEMIRALTISMKKPHTRGTTMKARWAAPYCWVTAVMLAMAVAVEPSAIPPKPAEITTAS